MARKVKCPMCGLLEENKLIMTQLEDKRWYHNKDCLEKKIKEKEFKLKELEQWDQLYQYIKKLHDLINLPPQLITRLQDLRNGQVFKNGSKVKLYKSGIEYDIILEAYKLASKNIEYSLKNKLDNSKDNRALNYCFSIMLGEINNVWENKKRKIKREEDMIREKEKNKPLNMNQPTYKKNYSDNDISIFLD